MKEPMAETHEFELSLTAEVGAAFVPFLKKQLRKARPLVKGPLSEFSVAVVGNRRMAELHDQFMSIPEPTDALTFELEHDGRGRVTSGEVVICLPVAKQKAKELGHETRIELLLYAIHGMLHLCGFDDKNEKDFRKMHAMEDRILVALGFGPVFAAQVEPVPSPASSRSAPAPMPALRRSTRPAAKRQTTMPVARGGRKCS